MRLLLFIFFVLFYAQGVSGQDARLAQQYYQNGEYEKAATLYENLYEKYGQNDYYFNQFVKSMIELEDYERAEKVLKREIKNRPDDVHIYVLYGNIFERQYKDEEAEIWYKKSIENLKGDRFTITRVANAFINLTKYDYAISAYEKGIKLLKDNEIFAYNLGDLYRRKGDVPPMITNYLNSLQANPNRINTLKTIFQRYLSEEDYLELQAQLFERIQTDQDNLMYIDLLVWVFLQNKDYNNALRQVMALDRRFGEDGKRVYQIGEIAFTDEDYDAAIKAFEYITDEKGADTPLYLAAKRNLLRSKRYKLVDGYNYTKAELRELELEYVSFLDEFGRNRATASIILELAELQGLYINDLDAAITELTALIELPGTDRRIVAEAKINLANFLLMQGEIWESTLLYSQVDKEFEEDLLGQKARFRNAKLSYYNGDFEWAQAQFDVLKSSTSKLIANDALDMAIFIMDNLGLDTTALPLEMFARADLLAFQNRFDAAFATLDSLLLMFPEHSLEDDIWYTRGQIHEQLGELDKAVDLYQGILDKYPEEIRADNALYAMALIYDEQRGNQLKAQELYEKLFIEYSNSTFAVDARKRYRKLRGDTVQ